MPWTSPQCFEETDVKMTASVYMVPEEVLTMIFSYLSFEDLIASVQEVCTHWQQVSRNKTLWKHHIYTPSKDSSSKTIIYWIKKGPKLQAVDFCNVEVSREVIEVLCDTCTDLRILRFHSKQTLDLKLLRWLLRCCPDIEELGISDDLFYLANKFQSVTRLGRLKLLKINSKVTNFATFNTSANNEDPEVSHVDRSFEILTDKFPNLIELNLEEAHFTIYDLRHVLVKKRDQLEAIHLPCCTSDRKCVLPLVTLCSKLKSLTLHVVCRRICPYLPQLPRSLKNVTLVQANFERKGYCTSLFEIFSQVTVFRFSLCCGPNNNVVETIALHCPVVEKLIFYGCIFVLENFNVASLRLMPELNSLVISEDADLSDKGVEFLSEMSELIEIEITNCKKVTIEGLKSLLGLPKLRRLKYDLLFKKYKPCDFQGETIARSVKNNRMQIVLYGCGYVPYTQIKCFRSLLPDVSLGIVNGRFARLEPNQRLVGLNLPRKDKSPMANALRKLIKHIGCEYFTV